jgi:decaprenyl-phosphate phosphoribosyltransferase
VLVVTCGALFIAAGKRLAELRRAGGTTEGGRRVLGGYTPSTLTLLLSGSLALTACAYCVWAFQMPDSIGIPWRPLTIVPFVACLGRYLFRVQRGEGEAPEDLVLTDRALLLSGIVWAVLFGLSVHAAG